MRGKLFTQSSKQVRESLILLNSHGLPYNQLPSPARLRLVEAAGLLRTNASHNLGLFVDRHTLLWGIVRESWLFIDMQSHYCTPSRGGAANLAQAKIAPVISDLYGVDVLPPLPSTPRPLPGGFQRSVYERGGYDR